MFKSVSQACQDLFAYQIMEGKKNGTYLDIGAGDAIGTSNTLRLSELGWTGIGLDIEPGFAWGWQHIRNHKYIQDDITIVDWDKLIDDNPMLQQKIIDYLSFDVDDATLQAILRFPFDRLRFRVITIEHDEYRVGNHVKNVMRDILRKAGYDLLCSDIKLHPQGYKDPIIFEDWWVDPREVNMNVAEKFRCDGKLGSDVIKLGMSSVMTLPVSIGEALDKFSILQIKKDTIKDENKLKEIALEIETIEPVVSSHITFYRELYDKLYRVNKLIWDSSENIRKIDKKSPSYADNLIWIMEQNDERYKIKSEINNTSGSHIKEQKSYNMRDLCIIKRSEALGDIVLLDPTIRQLAKQYRVWFLTIPRYNQVLESHPSVEKIINELPENISYKLFDMDNSYENFLSYPIHEGYLVSLGLPLDDTRYNIYLREEEKMKLEGRWVAVDIGNRNGGRQYYHGWEKVFKTLRSMGLKIILIGYRMGEEFEIDWDYRGTSIRQLFATIEAAEFFIGAESAPLHVAKSLGKRGVGMYCAYRMNAKPFADTKILPYFCHCRDGEPTVCHMLCKESNLDVDSIISLFVTSMTA